MIPFCGDLDGDGRFSDPIEYLRLFAQALAYGPRGVSIEQNPNPLPVLVEDQRRYYNEAYQKFIKGAFTVKVEDGDTPVNVPAPEGMEKRLSVLYQGGYSLRNIKETVDPNSWTMTTMFQIVNFSRSAMEVAVTFTLAVQGILGSALRILFPFCIVFSIDPYLRKQMLGNYLWFATAACIVLPIVTQVVSFFCYGVCNFVLYSQSAEPYHLYDASTMSVIQQNDPTLMIWFFTILSIICTLILIGSPSLAYAVTRMNLYQWLTGAVSGGFTMLTSVAMSYLTSAVGAALGQELDIARGDKNRQIEGVGSMNKYRVSQALAQGDRQKALQLAEGEYGAENTRLVGGMIVGRMGNQAELVTGLGAIRVDMDEKTQRAFLSGAVGMTKADLDAFKSLEGLNVEQMQAAIEANPALKGMLSKVIGKTPFVGGIASGVYDNVDEALGGTLGNAVAGKDATNALMELGKGKDGKFSTEQFTEQMYASMAATPEGLKTLEKAGVPLDKIGATMSDGNGLNFPQGGYAPNVADFAGGGSMTKLQRQNYQKLQNLMQKDPNFMPSLQKMCARHGWNPDHVLNMMALETANTFNPSIIGGGANKAKGVPHDYVGLIQFGSAARNEVGLPDNVYAASSYLKSIAPSQQLGYVEKYLQNHERNSGIALNSQSKMYAAVGAGSISGNDNQVIFRDGGFQQGDFGATRKISNAGYDGNSPWDFNKDGIIQQKEFGQAAHARLGAGQFFSFAQGGNQSFNAGAFRPVVRPQFSGGTTTGNLPFSRNSSVPVVKSPFSETDSQGRQLRPQQGQLTQTRNSARQYQDQLNDGGPVARETLAPILSKQVGIEGRREVVMNDNFRQKNLIRQQTEADVSITQKAAVEKAYLEIQKREMKDAMTDTTFNYGQAANQIKYGSQVSAADTQYGVSTQVSEWNRSTELQQQAMRFEQDIVDAKGRAGLSIINSVGNALAHQIEEAFEKLNNRY